MTGSPGPLGRGHLVERPADVDRPRPPAIRRGPGDRAAQGPVELERGRPVPVGRLMTREDGHEATGGEVGQPLDGRRGGRVEGLADGRGFFTSMAAWQPQPSSDKVSKQ